MDVHVPFDKALESLVELHGDARAPDGRWTLRPVRRSLTLTSAKHHLGDEYVIAAADDLDDFEMRWESADVLTLRAGEATFRLPRDQVSEILDVNLPEQPRYRTISFELVTELTLDITVEYVNDDE